MLRIKPTLRSASRPVPDSLSLRRLVYITTGEWLRSIDDGGQALYWDVAGSKLCLWRSHVVISGADTFRLGWHQARLFVGYCAGILIEFAGRDFRLSSEHLTLAWSDWSERLQVVSRLSSLQLISILGNNARPKFQSGHAHWGLNMFRARKAMTIVLSV